MLICSIYYGVDVIKISIQTTSEGSYIRLMDFLCKMESIKAQFVTSTCTLFLILFSHQYQNHLASSLL